MKKPNLHLTEDVFDAVFDMTETRMPGTRPDIADEMAMMSEYFSPLLDSFPDADPPDTLLGAIEDELDTLETAPSQSVRAHDGAWEKRTEKVWKKVIATDEQSGRSTYLLRCLPGASVRPHLHERAEHILVLEGELWVNGKLFSAGDAQISVPHSEHAEITMPAGCLVLVSV